MAQNSGNSEVKLRRVLSLSDLVIYGLIIIQPMAAFPLFGLANRDSQGHTVTVILGAMIAIIFTAISYGRMANRYPAAGSAYTYVGRGINPHLGFIAGFTMVMDYMIIPIICTIYSGITMNMFIPFIPTRVWFIVFAFGFTWLNLIGIRATNRANWIMMIFMCTVVFWFMGAAIRYLFLKNGLGGLLTTEPFYHKDTFSLAAIGRGTALAALTYIGFDGMTTLSEEVENPRRNVLLATVMTCLITGIWSGSQIYLAQAAVPWSDWPAFLEKMSVKFGANNALEKAIVGVSDLVGGSLLGFTVGFLVLLGSVGSGVTGMTGAARVLYGMGRDRILPPRVFGHLSTKYAVPSNNIVLIGLLTFVAANILTYDKCAHLINFGAFLGFMLVNLASIREYYLLGGKKTGKSFFKNFLPPIIGFVACAAVWLSLIIEKNTDQSYQPTLILWIGGTWLLIGATLLLISLREYYLNTKHKTVKSFFRNFILLPVVGFVACVAIWLSLIIEKNYDHSYRPTLVFWIGGTWLLIGVIFLTIRTKGFREKYEVRDIF